MAASVSDGIEYPLELAQDLNAIAFSSLQDRMLWDLGATIVRIALKQATEAFARKQDPNLGALVSIANAISEKADTRNWQSIPYAIHYARIVVAPGIHTLTLTESSPSGTYSQSERLTVDLVPGETKFLFVHTLDSLPPSSYSRR